MLDRTRARVLAAVVAAALAIGAPVSAAADDDPPGPLHTSGSDIVTASGDPYVIRAVSWFGLETPNCAPHGLWTLPLDEGLASIAGMGFTTVRVPFSNECLAARTTTSIDPVANPDLVGLAPIELLDTLIARAAAAGLSVILDRHRPDSAAQSELWYTDAYPEERWIADWVRLAQRYRDEPAVIGVDLHNEPRGAACWGCGDPARDWAAAAQRAGDAVLAVHPDLLIIVEGVENQPDGTSTWWGGGLAGARSHPVRLAVPDRVVYSPHEYPASVHAQDWFAAADYPANLEPLWQRNWGYLREEGIAPVLVGEFGTRAETESDRAWLDALVAYLARTGISYAYWSFNPNSGDTGGLVKDDWRTREADKLDALSPVLAARDVVPAARAPRASEPMPPSAEPRPLVPARTPAPRRGKPVPARAGDVSAAWMLQSTWDSGHVVELEIDATADIRAWGVSWPAPSATAVAHAWGLECDVTDGVVSCRGAEWARTIAAGGSVRVGVQLAGPAPATPPAVTVTASAAPRQAHPGVRGIGVP